MIFNHQLTINNERIYKQNVKTLEQTSNELKYYYKNYAFYSTQDGKLHPCYYPKAAYEFLKYGDIALATDFVTGGLEAVPPDVINGVVHMQEINKLISCEDFFVMSCQSAGGENGYFDYIVFLKQLNVYVKVFSTDDVKAVNNFSVKRIEKLQLTSKPNDIINPYYVIMTNSGELILKAGSTV